MLRRLGLEEQALQGAGRRARPGARGGAAGHPRGRRDPGAARRHRPRVPGGRPLHGRRRRSASAWSCRASRCEEFEESLRAAASCASGWRPWSPTACTVSPAEAEQEFRRRNEQVKAEYVVVPADTAGRSPPPTTRCSARFEANKDAYKLPERRVVSLPAGRRAGAAAAGHRHRARAARLLRGARDEFQQPRRSARSHILVKVKATPEATEGHADDGGAPLAQAALDQVKAGADFAAVAQEGLGGPGLGRAGRRPRLLPARAAWCPSSRTRPSRWTRGRCRTWCKTSFGYHVIRAVSRTRRDRRPPSPRSRSAIRQTRDGGARAARWSRRRPRGPAALARGRSLEDAAKEQGFTVQKSAPLARGDVQPPLASPGPGRARVRAEAGRDRARAVPASPRVRVHPRAGGPGPRAPPS